MIIIYTYFNQNLYFLDYLTNEPEFNIDINTNFNEFNNNCK